ncbi:MAG: (2Fe-2S) ferredoxin domain-containing protein [Trueperaceae bacterium]|nr:(2Fe-2S) ferredoxin domain-containing protein [Trueperaceae bacterium]
MNQERPTIQLDVCFGKSCTKRGAREVAETMQAECARQGVRAVINRVGCMDLCKHACSVKLSEPRDKEAIFAKVHPRMAAGAARQLLDHAEVGEGVGLEPA